MDNPGVAGVVYSTHRWCCTKRASLVLHSARIVGVACSGHGLCRTQHASLVLHAARMAGVALRTHRWCCTQRTSLVSQTTGNGWCWALAKVFARPVARAHPLSRAMLPGQLA
uniref:Uncharacterized protein n=1 Tax=Chlamydomonas euryale TaxID=1486919 RepID=A0A7R9VDX1_9CHLO